MRYALRGVRDLYHIALSAAKHIATEHSEVISHWSEATIYSTSKASISRKAEERTFGYKMFSLLLVIQ